MEGSSKGIIQVCTDFQKIQESLQSCKYQKGDMKQICTVYPQILCATVQNLVTLVTWCMGFVHSWCNLSCFDDTYIEGLRKTTKRQSV